MITTKSRGLLYMYNLYDNVRRYLANLLDRKCNVWLERMRYFRSFFSHYHFDSILDLGCGSGLLFLCLSNDDTPKLRVGVDLVKRVGKHYQHIVSDATQLPFKNETFSAVAALSILEHIPIDRRENFWNEVKRVTQKDGMVIIQLPNRYFPIESHSYLPFFGFLPSYMHSFAYGAHGDYTAVPSLRNVVDALQRHGFRLHSIFRYKAQFLPFPKLLDKIGFFRIFPLGYMIFGCK